MASSNSTQVSSEKDGANGDGDDELSCGSNEDRTVQTSTTDSPKSVANFDHCQYNKKDEEEEDDIQTKKELFWRHHLVYMKPDALCEYANVLLRCAKNPPSQKKMQFDYFLSIVRFYHSLLKRKVKDIDELLNIVKSLLKSMADEQLEEYANTLGDIVGAALYEEEQLANAATISAQNDSSMYDVSQGIHFWKVPPILSDYWIQRHEQKLSSSGLAVNENEAQSEISVENSIIDDKDEGEGDDNGSLQSLRRCQKPARAISAIDSGTERFNSSPSLANTYSPRDIPRAAASTPKSTNRSVTVSNTRSTSLEGVLKVSVTHTEPNSSPETKDPAEFSDCCIVQ